MKKLSIIALIIFHSIFVSFSVYAQPLTSTNYKFIDAQIDGIGDTQTSANYSLLNSIDPTADPGLQGTSYTLKSGFPNGIEANVPTINCFEANTTVSTSCSFTGVYPAAAVPMNQVCGYTGCYNKAKLEINNQNNPYDTLYLVSLSTDAFASNIQYLSSTHTLTSTYSITNYMTRCALEGHDANNPGCTDDTALQRTNIYGLTPNVTYTVRIRALSGDFTETAWSPTATATTVNPVLAYDLDIAATDTESSGPYTIALGLLTPGSVTTATNRIWVDINTNWNTGMTTYVYDSNNGLYSSSTTGLIPAESENLATDPNNNGGFGFRVETIAQTSAGPLQRDSAFYNVSFTDYVGGFNNSAPYERLLFTDTSGSNLGGINAGRAQVRVKAKPHSSDPTANDYTDDVTFIIATNL